MVVVTRRGLGGRYNQLVESFGDLCDLNAIAIRYNRRDNIRQIVVSKLHKVLHAVRLILAHAAMNADGGVCGDVVVGNDDHFTARSGQIRIIPISGNLDGHIFGIRFRQIKGVPGDHHRGLGIADGLCLGTRDNIDAAALGVDGAAIKHIGDRSVVKSCFRHIQGNSILPGRLLVKDALFKGELGHVTGHDLVYLQMRRRLVESAVDELDLDGILELVRGIRSAVVQNDLMQQLHIFTIIRQFLKVDTCDSHGLDPLPLVRSAIF